MRPRQTVRVYVLDPANRVLLHYLVIQRSGAEFAFWLIPGGEIEANETPAEAARRELHEELGLHLEVTGPLYTETNSFELDGELRDNTDYFFLARCAPEAPRLLGITPAEIAATRDMRWWSASQIEAAIATSATRFFPADLATRIPHLAKK